MVIAFITLLPLYLLGTKTSICCHGFLLQSSCFYTNLTTQVKAFKTSLVWNHPPLMFQKMSCLHCASMTLEWKCGKAQNTDKMLLKRKQEQAVEYPSGVLWYTWWHLQSSVIGRSIFSAFPKDCSKTRTIFHDENITQELSFNADPTVKRWSRAWSLTLSQLVGISLITLSPCRKLLKLNRFRNNYIIAIVR